MADLKLELDPKDIVEGIREQTDKIVKKIEKDLQKAAVTLGKSGKEYAEKLSGDKLPSKLDSIYRENLYMEQKTDNIVVIGIREDALWIEEGRKGGFMEELLETNKSGNPAKVSKDGNKYRIIPMEKSTSMKNLGGKTEEAVSELRNFLKKEGQPYSKTRALELDDSGSPRIGKVKTFDIKKMREGNKKSVSSLSRNLQKISVFQDLNPKTGKVERNIMEFRVISEKSKEQGKWIHPGRDGEKILDETFKWIENTWQTRILPELKGKYGRK